MNSNDLVPIIFIAGFIVLMAFIIAASVRAARKRTLELTTTAQQIGFEFLGNTWSGPAVSPRHRISILQRVRGKCLNAMTGASGALQISLFDYTYRVGKSTTTQTLAAFSQNVELPPFALRPENFLDRIGDAILHNDLDFGSNPEFSRRYLLRSPDETNTRRLFTPGLMTYLEQTPSNWNIEGTGATLILYRGGSPVNPSDLPAFLEETSRIARTFFSSEGLRKSGG